MDYIGIQSIKKSYANQLLNSEQPDKAISVYSSLYSPVMSADIAYLHPEAEYNEDIINNLFTDTSIDIVALDNELSHVASNYEALMNRVQQRLAAVNAILDNETNRVNDVNTICNYFPEFSSVKAISKKDITGTVGVLKDSIFCAKTDTLKEVPLKITSVEGNGYEGNKYVYMNSVFQDTVTDTKNRDHLIDSNALTKYEYSRVTVKGNKQGIYPPDANYDQEEARCTISFEADESFNLLHLDYDPSNSIVLEEAYYADSDQIYYPIMRNEYAINNPSKLYQDANYIYMSGLVATPYTNYAKLQLRSDGVTKESLAFSIIDTESKTKQRNIIKTLDRANRHVITLQNISAYSGSFSQGLLQTGELITTPINSIAIFASEYIPPHFPNKQYIHYFLTVNGVEYPVLPINSNRNDISTKIIRMSDYSNTDSYISHIKESIKSASLKIVIDTPSNDQTPFINNLKILYGTAVQK